MDCFFGSSVDSPFFFYMVLLCYIRRRMRDVLVHFAAMAVQTSDWW